MTGEAGSPTTAWSGLDHLEGLTVSIVADGVVQSNKVVSSGAVTIDEAASAVEIGLPYTHIVEPLPPSEVGAAGGARRVRLIEGVFRLQNTSALKLDVGRGTQDVALRQIGEDPILDAPLPLVSGDIRVRALGWQSDGQQALWKIEQDVPLPFTLLSVTTELKVND